MKKILYIFITFLIISGCKKSSFVADFDQKPEERMSESIALVNNTLIGATNGWIATLPTNAGGGYGFYMTFDANQNVTMYGDLNDNTATKLGVSTFRVKTGLGADLIFDTYNYISMLADPNPATFGGVQPTGFKSDVEFTYVRSTSDSIFFIGKNYRQPLAMVKATAAQKAAYTSNGLKTSSDNLKSFFTTMQNPYIEMVSGNATLKVSVSVSFTNALATGKRASLTALLAGTTVASATAKVGLTVDGISITSTGLVFQGVTFVKFGWKDATTLAMYDATGKEYVIKSSPIPLIPLHLLFGSKYSGLLSEFKTIYPGTSTNGAVILNYFYNNLAVSAENGVAVFNYGRMNFVWDILNSRLTFNSYSSQSLGVSVWTTTTVFNYTKDANGVYTFTVRSAPSGGYTTKLQSKLYNFILANRIAFDYYLDGATVYAKMSSLDDPTTVMTFVLQ